MGNSDPSGRVGARDGLTVFCKIPSNASVTSNHEPRTISAHVRFLARDVSEVFYWFYFYNWSSNIQHQVWFRLFRKCYFCSSQQTTPLSNGHVTLLLRRVSAGTNADLLSIKTQGRNFSVFWNKICGLWRQKQVSRAGISNCIPHDTVGCNYLSLPEIPAPGPKVLI